MKCKRFCYFSASIWCLPAYWKSKDQSTQTHTKTDITEIKYTSPLKNTIKGIYEHTFEYINECTEEKRNADTHLIDNSEK